MVSIPRFRPTTPLTMPTILFGSVPNSTMVLEKKISSIASPSCLPIMLLSGSIEIHLISRVNIIGFRADLICLMGSLASIGFSPLFRTLSPGYFNVVSGYLKHLSSCGFKDTSEDYMQISLLWASISLKHLYPKLYCSTTFVVHLAVEHSSGCNRALDFI